ncbi:MAG: c-type cytochrome [Anaerolineales bacterium]
MNEEFKKRYKDKYYSLKQKGVKFFPDIIYKDLVVSFGLFILLILLATFIGVKNEPKADPSDTSYIPRPEWYFLFLFQFLKYFPGKLEWVGAAVIPGIAVLTLFLLPFIDRNPYRHFSKRKIAISVMTVIVVGMVVLTIIAAVTTPPQPSSESVATNLTEKIAAGQDLYSVNCVECHGADGEGGEIKGVAGLEGVVVKPIHDSDVMYSFTDDTLANIISMGMPNRGMTPFGRAYGGELSPSEIENIVTFMRYTWDDRAELPPEAAQAAAIPTLAPNEIPSYDVQIAPIVKRYCVSCHRPGKENNHYTMESYDEVMKSGDHAPNVVPGDLNSNLIRMIHREEIPAGGPMPPTKPLPADLVQMFERWVQGGAPQTAEQAKQATGSNPLPSNAPATPATESSPTVEATEPAPQQTPTSSAQAITPVTVTEEDLKSIAALRKILELPELQLTFVKDDHMINSPTGDLAVMVYQDSEGRLYSVDQTSRQVVEMDGRNSLAAISSLVGSPTLDDLRAKAIQIATALYPDFKNLSQNLVYEEGSKGDYFFFTWRDQNAETKMNKPFLQMGFFKNGGLFAFYNTLNLK